MDNTIRMTEYRYSSGCDCKISPKVLDTLLKTELPAINYPTRLMENSSPNNAVDFLETDMELALKDVIQKVLATSSDPLVHVQ